jgi:hypothetical protein
MRAKALLASVLIFDFERMSVGAFALNSHVRPASRTAEDQEKLYSESVKHRVKVLLSAPAFCVPLLLPQSQIPDEQWPDIGIIDKR